MAGEDDCRKGLIVTGAESGQKLLNFLRRRVEAGDGDIHRWIRTGQVRVDGSRAKAFDRLAEGSVVRVPPFAMHAGMPEGRGPCPGVGEMLPPVVYEDDEILVLAKPSGLPVQGGTGHSDSIASRLAAAYALADFVPAPVHRLDRDTSGLLVVGKTYAAVRSLTDAFAGRSGRPLRKEYLAWVEGTWQGGERELRDFIVKNESSGGMMRVPASRAAEYGAKEAVCIVRPLKVGRDKGRACTLVLVRLLTGRKHQIRVQLSGTGHPVVGDMRYGSGGNLLLHAWRVVIPRDGQDDMVLELLPPWKGAWKVQSVSARNAPDVP